MSDSYLKIIPTQPDYMPSQQAQERLPDLLKALVPRAENVDVVAHDEVGFVDQGENFDSVACPHCKQALDMEWWQDAMGAASEKGFSDLAVHLPCCRTNISLNDLDYRMPAGFARFVIEVRNPERDDVLDAHAIAELRDVIGAPIRQIFARY